MHSLSRLHFQPRLSLSKHLIVLSYKWDVWNRCYQRHLFWILPCQHELTNHFMLHSFTTVFLSKMYFVYLENHKSDYCCWLQGPQTSSKSRERLGRKELGQTEWRRVRQSIKCSQLKRVQYQEKQIILEMITWHSALVHNFVLHWQVCQCIWVSNYRLWQCRTLYLTLYIQPNYSLYFMLTIAAIS